MFIAEEKLFAVSHIINLSSVRDQVRGNSTRNKGD
jgi:hypothetical protein